MGWLSRALQRVGTTDPLNLAVLRIVVFALLASWTGDFIWFNSAPRIFLDPPFAWGAAVAPRLPLDPLIGGTVGVVFQVSSLCAAAGLATRLSAPLSALLSLWVLGLPQLFGKIDHHHHLVWFALILAASPCGEALSLDAWLRKARGGRPSLREVSALPLRAIWILLGFVYFFPGLWKLGVFKHWVLGDDLKLILWQKWAELGPSFEPIWRIDRWPAAYRFGALLTILFELSFLFLILFRRARLFAAAAGVLFHLSILGMMNINSMHIVAMYVSLIDWGRLRARWQQERPVAEAASARPSIAAVVICATLIAGNLVAGFARIDSWPFAVYPTFAYRPNPIYGTLQVQLVATDGRIGEADTRDIQQRFGTARWYRLMRRISSAPASERRALGHALVRFLEENGVALDGVSAVRIVGELRSVDPARRGELLDRVLILEMRLGPRSEPDERSATEPHGLFVDECHGSEIFDRQTEGFEERDLVVRLTPGGSFEEQIADFPADVLGATDRTLAQSEQVVA